MSKILIIIPAYNEQDCIENVVMKIKAVTSDNSDIDICVINDGSTDKTLDKIMKLQRKHNIIALNLINNLGIGGAVQTGYRYAYYNNYDIAIQIDGDGQHDPKYIFDMIKLLDEDKCDMVIGSRFCDKTKYKQTFMRMFGSNILSFIIKVLSHKKIYDVTSGYRGVNKKIIKRFYREYPYDYPETCTNLSLELAKKRIIEIPVEMNKRETGVSSISPVKAISFMLKVTLTLLITKFRKQVKDDDI